MKIALLAEFAVLLKREFLLHFLLVALGVVRDATTNRALQFGHVFLDLSHKNKINTIERVRGLLYGNIPFPSTVRKQF